MTIRDAEREDLVSITDIYNDAILHTTAVYDYEPHSLDSRIAWFENRRSGGFPVIVYEVGGAVAGFASFGPFRPHQGYRYTVEHSLYVHREYRKRGIGRALLERLIELAESSGYAVLVGGIDAANVESIRLHERFGFEHAGTIPKAGCKFGRWLDLAFYHRQLRGPASP
ncbi:GNAT family N-acetyltransferase [Paenibacillus sp.]|uniref:GNAT family N-acetyltransferase n=1 Tax=Paenibacillus sp. TaxID=58172 RepID=UPI002D66D249|nr:GNAT family N-acetyltransferase [Paenibacillus sp.]HZG86823.1 GNAT family N-acetyltransferase [Paenibacillus sp.]